MYHSISELLMNVHHLPRRAQDTANTAGGRMALILIVDDSPTEVHAMRTTLERHGYRIESASDGAEAIVKAKALKPDLIFMDVVMPGVNGFQATRKLSADPDTKAIPVIMVTSKDQETDRIWGIRQGAKDYLVKPVAADQLVEKAQAALAS
jgi:twitching motility two-component system response regulator PilH